MFNKRGKTKIKDFSSSAKIANESKIFTCSSMFSQTRGQLTIFIIIAIVLLFSVLVYFFIVTQESEIDLDAQRSGPAGEVYVYVEACIQTAAFSAIQNFGYQQGYHIIPEDRSLETVFYRIAYYYLRGNSLVPRNDFLERELVKILNDKILQDCSDFSDFEGRFEVNSGNVKSQATIFEDKVVINVDYPLLIRSDETSVEVSGFTYTLPVRLGHVIDVSRILVSKIKEEPSAIDLTFLLNQDVDISVTNYDECSQVYIILDEQSQVNNEPYAFSFAVGFSEENCIEG